jgi:hypothetical protein
MLAASEASERDAQHRLAETEKRVAEMRGDMEKLAEKGQGAQRTAARVAQREQQLQVNRRKSCESIFVSRFSDFHWSMGHNRGTPSAPLSSRTLRLLGRCFPSSFADRRTLPADCVAGAP